MAKDFFQDMVKVKRAQKLGAEIAPKEPMKAVLEDKPIPEPEPKKKAPQRPRVLKKEFEPEFTETSRKSHGNSKPLWAIAITAVLFLFFGLSFVFSGANIIINPRVKDLAIKKNFFAVKDAISEDLSFDLVAVSGEEVEMVKGGEAKEISVSAEGTVAIFNNFSSASQTLDVDTRLLGSNDRIYKTKKKVVVPGIKDGKPGSVEVDIYASEAGEEYNSVPIDFSIVGFKGTPKYEKFYARSKGDIKGGLYGVFSTISDSEKNDYIANLRNRLKEKLTQNILGTLPPGFVLLRDAVLFETDNEEVGVAGSDGMVPLKVSGTLYGFLFEEKNLTKKIVAGAVENYDGSDVFIPNLTEFSFSLAEQDLANLKSLTRINFSLSGNSKIIWRIDEQKLKNEMLGKRKEYFNEILSTYPNIVSAEVAFRPFWKKSFPKKESGINLTINYPE